MDMNRTIRTFQLALATIVAAGTVVAAPQLTIKETSFNFGFVPQNCAVSHPFWLYSTGTDTLRILKIVPG